MTPEKISVILTTFNSAQFVASAVQSVRNQTFPNIHLLAVDNNSTDSTVEVSARIRGTIRDRAESRGRRRP